jgi:hypothetical protein
LISNLSQKTQTKNTNKAITNKIYKQLKAKEKQLETFTRFMGLLK